MCLCVKQIINSVILILMSIEGEKGKKGRGGRSIFFVETFSSARTSRTKSPRSPFQRGKTAFCVASRCGDYCSSFQKIVLTLRTSTTSSSSSPSSLWPSNDFRAASVLTMTASIKHVIFFFFFFLRFLLDEINQLDDESVMQSGEDFVVFFFSLFSSFNSTSRHGSS